MTSLRQHFQNLRKVSSQIFVKVMWSKFHRNRSNSVQIKGAYRQTHRRTDRDRPGDNIFSPEIARRHLHQSNIFKNVLVTSCFFFPRRCSIFQEKSFFLSLQNFNRHQQRKYRLNQQTMHIFVFSGSKSTRIHILFVILRYFDFLKNFNCFSNRHFGQKI